jgi:hypothetical protein
MTNGELFDVSLEEQVACVERELGYRQRVYARRVAEGKMHERVATVEIRRMQAVLATLKRVAQGGHGG